MVEGGEPLLDGEARQPEGQHESEVQIPDDGSPHQPAALVRAADAKR